MTIIFTTIILTLMTIVTGALAFGFKAPARSIAIVLFLAFAILDVISATYEFKDYRIRHPKFRA